MATSAVSRAPYEVRRCIADVFSEDIQFPETMDESGAIYYNGEINKKRKAAYKNLCNLALVDRRFRGPAQDAMVRHVYLSGLEEPDHRLHHTLFPFLYAIGTNTSLATGVRELSVKLCPLPSDFDSIDTEQDLTCTINRFDARHDQLAVALQAIDNSPFSKFRREQWKFNMDLHACEAVVGAILCLLTAVCRLNIITPEWGMDAMHDWKRPQILSTLFGDLSHHVQAGPNPSLDGLQHLLPKLTSMRLKAGPLFKAEGFRYLHNLTALELDIQLACIGTLSFAPFSLGEDLKHIKKVQFNCGFGAIDDQINYLRQGNFVIVVRHLLSRMTNIKSVCFSYQPDIQELRLRATAPCLRTSVPQGHSLRCRIDAFSTHRAVSRRTHGLWHAALEPASGKIECVEFPTQNFDTQQEQTLPINLMRLTNLKRVVLAENAVERVMAQAGVEIVGKPDAATSHVYTAERPRHPRVLY